MRTSPRLIFLLGSIFLPMGPARLLAQDSAVVQSAPLAPERGKAAIPVVTVSGDSIDRLRTAQLMGRLPMGGLMLRSTSSLLDPRSWGDSPSGISVVLPMVTTVTNSELPFGQNDGALWAGKGYNFRALAGIVANFGPVQLVAIPEFVSATNYNMSIDPTDLRFARPLPATRSEFSSPFNVVPYSIDLPYRFGDGAIRKIYPGQSSVTVSFGPLQVGAGTENEWWGPAIRNPLILSDNAPGFPHAFLRTGKPLIAPFGQIEGRWIVGGLRESDFFNTDITDDVRSLSAIALTWKRKPSSGFTVGVMRSVFAAVDGYSAVPANAFDFITGTGRPNALPAADSTFTPGSDQIFSVFGHWMLPHYGLESYVEWGRAEFPQSFGDFFLTPNHTRGYTAGLQWVRRAGREGSHFRTQAEFTNVEQSSTYRFGPIGSFYASRAAIQGYTNEGQMLGTGIGPGSSGQWFAADYVGGVSQLGVTFGRTRFNNDAFFQKTNPHRCFHDVTVYPGLRAGLSTGVFRVRADYHKLTRYNTFFQRTRGCEDDESAIGDRSSHHLSITLNVLGW